MAGSSVPNSQFEKLAAGDDDVELGTLLLEIAQDAYPGLCVGSARDELARLEEGARRRLAELPAAATLRERLERLSHFLHREEGFDGDADDYYDPRNSYLNEVLARRTGIPISLSAVYLCVGRAAGLPLYGVGAPAHFVVGCCGEGGERWFVDAFHSGDVLDFSACRCRIEQLVGQSGCLCSDHFRPTCVRQIVIRTLRNLKGCYLAQEEWAAALPVQRRLLALSPCDPCERRDLGLICLRAGKACESLGYLKQYLSTCSREEREQVAPFLHQATRQVVELN